MASWKGNLRVRKGSLRKHPSLHYSALSTTDTHAPLFCGIFNLLSVPFTSHAKVVSGMTQFNALNIYY